MGIEPTSLAWKAKVLPLNYTRNKFHSGGEEEDYSGPHRLRAWRGVKNHSRGFVEPLTGSHPPPEMGETKSTLLVEGGGFEPPKAEPSDLQSDPFGHSGTPPKTQAAYFDPGAQGCQPRQVDFLSKNENLT